MSGMNANYSLNSQMPRQSGSSLLEVVITIFIITIGLLALAGMQAIGLSNNHGAYQRSQATVLAYDMADRMRANTSAIDNYLTTSMDPADAEQQADCTTTDGCSIILMAENDLYIWNAALTTALPGPEGEIKVDDQGTGTVDDDIYTVSVNWVGDGAVGEDSGFQVSFLP